MLNNATTARPRPEYSTTKRLLPRQRLSHSAPAAPPYPLQTDRRAMPTGSYLMTSSFSYRKLKKLPSSHLEEEDHDQQQQPQPQATTIQDYYHSYYRALAVVARRRRAWGRRRGGTTRPRLRISSLARALRRKAAAVGGRVRASVAKVTARLREGRPYIGDLFAGNYMFMQVAPSPTMAGSGLDADKGFVPFTEYYYGKLKMTNRPPPAPQLHPAAADDKV